MLLAVEDVTAFTVAMACVTALGAFGASYLNYKQGVAKLSFDVEQARVREQFAALTVRVAGLADEVAECHAERDTARTELAANWRLTRRLMSRMKEHGIECDEHDPDAPDRRRGPDPDYRGPERRTPPEPGGTP